MVQKAPFATLQAARSGLRRLEDLVAITCKKQKKKRSSRPRHPCCHPFIIVLASFMVDSGEA